jgi:hypothetical protein
MQKEPSTSILTINAPFANITATGIVFDPKAKPTLEQFKGLLDTLVRAHKSADFWLGDAINYAQKRFGDEYRPLLAKSGLTNESVTRAANIARAVPISRRNEQLDFTHYLPIANLPPDEQEHWIGITAESIERGDDIGSRRLKLSIARGELIPNDATVGRSHITKSLRDHYINHAINLANSLLDMRDAGLLEKMTPQDCENMRDDWRATRLQEAMEELANLPQGNAALVIEPE